MGFDGVVLFSDLSRIPAVGRARHIMELSHPPRLATRLASPRRRLRGFGLLELGLALLAIGLMGYIVVGEVRKWQQRGDRARFVTELRSLAAAFSTYRTLQGDWPPATNPEARMPRGMEAALANTPWLSGPAIGGSYDWVPPARLKVENVDAAKEPVKLPPAAGRIAVTAFSPDAPLTLTPEDLRSIDREIDDGNLTTGLFRAGFNGWPTYTVEVVR